MFIYITLSLLFIFIYCVLLNLIKDKEILGFMSRWKWIFLGARRNVQDYKELELILLEEMSIKIRF